MGDNGSPVFFVYPERSVEDAMPENDITAREAKWGERMIEVKVRLWTDNIAEGKGNILPKHAWGSGVVRIERNSAHGISPQHPILFHSLMELGAVIEKVLIQHGIKIHPSNRMIKYLVSAE